MPSLGADMDEGTLLEWLVEPGDAVHRGDIVAVVDTAKSAVEVESFEAGVVVRPAGRARDHRAGRDAARGVRRGGCRGARGARRHPGARPARCSAATAPATAGACARGACGP